MSSPEHSPPPGRSDVSSNGVRASRRAQVAAVGALVILFFLFWLTVSLIANDPVGLVLSFVSLFLVVFFAWFIVTRRGVRRWLVLPIAFLALLALGSYGYDQKYQLAVMLVLAAAVRRGCALCGASRPGSSPAGRTRARTTVAAG